MRLPCFRCQVLWASCALLLTMLPAPFASAVPPTHSTAVPGKPSASAPARTTFGGLEYLEISEVARRLGLKSSWIKPGRSVRLVSGNFSAEIFGGTREALVNKLRVFLGDPVMIGSDQLFVSRLDFERCLAPLLQSTSSVPRPRTPSLIVIDPGHGGPDSGAVNPRVGVMEKDVAFDVAKRLKLILEKAGYRVVLTRSGDHLLLPKVGPEELAKRDKVATDNHADLFVSIHFNDLGNADKTTRGAEVYTYAPATQHATEWWDKSEPGDPHLQTTDQPGNRFDRWNVVFAQSLHRHLIDGLHTPDRGKKLMHLAVLRWLDCPAVLVEPAILTQDDEARVLSTPDYRQKIAQSLANGIADFSAILKSSVVMNPIQRDNSSDRGR